MIRSTPIISPAIVTAALASLLGVGLAQADAVKGDLFFTTFNGGNNVHKVAFNYDGTTFTLGSVANLAATPGADGIIFAPDGDLLVGGQGPRVHKVNPTSGTFTTVNPGNNAFHLSLDPSGTKVWASSIPGTLSSVPLTPFGAGTVHPLSGDDTVITTLAFDGSGKAYYTSSGSGGIGSVGKIDLTTFTTTRMLSSVPAAHGMTFDSFTGDLILMGDSHITQIDPATFAIVSDRSFAGAGVNFDQGTVDGKGHLFAADNNGKLLFLDYKASGLVNDVGNFSALPFLASALDDVAPLSGAGAPTPTGTPDAGSTLGLLALAMGAVGCMSRKPARA
jgi:hypothetical protein